MGWEFNDLANESQTFIPTSVCLCVFASSHDNQTAMAGDVPAGHSPHRRLTALPGGKWARTAGDREGLDLQPRV